MRYVAYDGLPGPRGERCRHFYIVSEKKRDAVLNNIEDVVEVKQEEQEAQKGEGKIRPLVTKLGSNIKPFNSTTWFLDDRFDENFSGIESSIPLGLILFSNLG